MKTTYKNVGKGSFNFKKSRHNIMNTFFDSNISEFTGNLLEIMDGERTRH